MLGGRKYNYSFPSDNNDVHREHDLCWYAWSLSDYNQLAKVDDKGAVT